MSRPILRIAIAGKPTISDVQKWLGVNFDTSSHIGGVSLKVEEPPFADGGYYGYYGPYKEDWTMKLELIARGRLEVLQHALAIEVINHLSTEFGGTYLLTADFVAYLLYKNGQYLLTQVGKDKFEQLSFLPGVFEIRELPETDPV